MRFITLLPVVVLAACASAPKAPPTPAPTAAATEAASSAKQLDQIDASNIAEAQAAGYKVVNEKGNTLLCKKSLLTGTRLQYVTTCLTAMEWKENSDAARAAVKPNPVWKPERGN